MGRGPMYCSRCLRRFEDEEHRFCPYDGTKLVATPDVSSLRAKPTPETGVVLGGRYEVRGLIGRGGMARIYLALDRNTSEPVAIKMLDSLHLRAPGARARFDREAKAANALAHPNIVKVLDTGERPDGVPFLVMEYLFGETLGDWLRRETTMPLHLALPVLSQTASALGAAHRAGIVHRDVKPDNLFLVGEPGEPYNTKVLDFGLSKLEAAKAVTQAGVAVGTPEYMPPEQVVGDKSDSRSDVYALGVMMYRMLVGELPFRADDYAVLLARQLIAPPREPSEAQPGIDRATEGVILKALRKKPEDRYSTMEAFCDDLERLMGKRLGSLSAGLLPRGPDVYEPKDQLSRTAAKFFYNKLGMTPPAWK
ncbi:serine/threonine-protein kinase [Polyangium jinanense]|nr:serine/threonine-protein kinase [Polyangium jinanense]